MKKYLLLVIFLCFPLISWATHLIGGEMTYTYLGNDEYEITLIIYVDCGPSNTTGITFDNTVTIAVYNTDFSEYNQIELSNPIETELGDETVGNDCLELPTDLCILQGVYTGTITLPSSPDGYILAYQRCCRNPSIINVPDPSTYGNTYTTNIPGTDVAPDYNSSPTFSSYPPLALCLGDEINVDLSAVDIDGDSLSYEFTTPYHGANNTNPTEISPPPFPQVPWTTGYSETYPMDSSPTIAINSQTGIINGTPTQMGMYIVGVKVNEYRDGVLINSIIRDFRFLVVDCNVTTASIPLSSWYCNSLTVNFTNNSFNADSYFWDFGFNNDNSTQFEPNYTYPDTGIYTVSLIANPNTACADTNIITLPLYTELLPYFESPEPQCVDDNNFNLVGEGIAPQGTSFFWDFGPLASPSNSNVPNPTNITYPAAGSYPVSYNLQYNDCDETYIGYIEVFDEEIFPEIPSLDAQCLEDNSFDFSSNGIYPENSTFLWNFGTTASPQFSTSETPTDVQFSSSGNQNIILTVSANGCSEADTNHISIHEVEDIQITNSNPGGCEPHNVSFSSNLQPTNYTYNWDLGNGVTSTNQSIQTTYPAGTYDVNLSVLNTSTNCSYDVTYEDYVTVVPQPISIFEISSDYLAYGEPVVITNLAQHSEFYEYVFSSGHTTTEEEPSYTPTSTGDFTIWQYASNEYECFDSSSVNLSVYHDYTFWVPNVFTPDGDQINDEFYPIHTNIEKYRLKIFNRWGEMLFNEMGENPKWTGFSADGVLHSSDSYVYVIDYYKSDTEITTVKGYVILIR